MLIHRTAIVDPQARLGEGVRLGAFSVIGPGVVIGAGSEIGSHVVVERDTLIGAGCHVHSHAVIGGDPQDLSWRGGHSFCEIGAGTVIREYATVNRGSHGEAVTRVGRQCLLMAGVHVAHDCQVGDRVIMANLATLAGHVIVEERAMIGGLAAFHQFVRVGRLAMVGGTAGVMQDVPPFCMVQGAPPATVRGLNLVGLKRTGVDERSITALKHCFRLMFRRGMTRENALAEIASSVEQTPEVAHFAAWFKAASQRGVCRGEPSGMLHVIGGEGRGEESVEAEPPAIERGQAHSE